MIFRSTDQFASPTAQSILCAATPTLTATTCPGAAVAPEGSLRPSPLRSPASRCLPRSCDDRPLVLGRPPASRGLWLCVPWTVAAGVDCRPPSSVICCSVIYIYRSKSLCIGWLVRPMHAELCCLYLLQISSSRISAQPSIEQQVAAVSPVRPQRRCPVVLPVAASIRAADALLLRAVAPRHVVPAVSLRPFIWLHQPARCRCVAPSGCSAAARGQPSP